MYTADTLGRPTDHTERLLMNTENITTDPTPRPLGYWLRTVDGLLAHEFEAAFHAEGITRRDWRILTLLAGDGVDPERIARLQRGGGTKLRPLLERGWVIESDGAWSLTDEGRAAQARLAEIVTGIRTKVSATVSDEDFATTVATLEAIARELGGDPAERGPRGPGCRRRPRGFGPGRRGHRHPAFDPRSEGHGSGEGFGHGRDEGPCHPRGERSHHGRHREGAYERGFDAGFARGAERGAV